MLGVHDCYFGGRIIPADHPPDSVSGLSQAIREFAEERDWMQFHTPKNLASSIAIEAAELMEVFQWESGDRPLTEPQQAKVREELADVLIYCLQLANVAGIDPLAAARDKLADNARRYPPDEVRGSSEKRGH